MFRRTAHALTALITVVALTFTKSFAQAPRAIVTQPLEWISTNFNFKLSQRVTFSTEGQYRFVGAFEPMQFQFRNLVDIQLNKSWSVAPGYVYTWNPTYGKQPNQFVNNEHRFFEQVIYKHHNGRFFFSHRGRLEQRYIQVHVDNNGEIVNKGYDFYANRARYRMMVNVPLNKTEMSAGAIFASVYDEVFISWGSQVTYHRPDQNRIFVGLGYQASKHFNINTGFLYQMLVKSGGSKQENNVGIQAMLTYNFDLTKQE